MLNPTDPTGPPPSGGETPPNSGHRAQSTDPPAQGLRLTGLVQLARRLRTHTATNKGAVMPLMDHLLELRRRLIICLISLVPGTVAGFVAFNQLSAFLTAPLCQLPSQLGIAVNQAANGSGGLTPCGPLVITGSLLAPFAVQVKVALAAAVIASAPVWLWHLWAFLAPGLHRHERRRAVFFLSAALPLFACGLGLLYWLLPQMVQILVGFTPANVTFLADYSTYLTLLMRLGMVFGLAFTTPVIVVGLNAVGVLPAKKLRQVWRPVVLGVFVFAAVATPTGDPFTLMVLALPLLVLVGMSWVVCALNDRRRARRGSKHSDQELSEENV